jgi:hypothetical protein
MRVLRNTQLHLVLRGGFGLLLPDSIRRLTAKVTTKLCAGPVRPEWRFTPRALASHGAAEWPIM